jgi:serine/threonine protein phosphatase PrpC
MLVHSNAGASNASAFSASISPPKPVSNFTTLIAAFGKRTCDGYASHEPPLAAICRKDVGMNNPHRRMDDALLISRSTLGSLFLMAVDGVGGTEGADVAAKLLVEAAQEKLESPQKWGEILALAEMKMKYHLTHHKTVPRFRREYIHKNRNMSAAYLAAFVDPISGSADLLYQGDVRAFIIDQSGKILTITEAHTKANRLIRNGSDPTTLHERDFKTLSAHQINQQTWDLSLINVKDCS